MDKRAAKREARRRLAGSSRIMAANVADGSPDGGRLAEAYTDLAEFLDPRPLVVPVDPDQLTLDVGVTPDAGG